MTQLVYITRNSDLAMRVFKYEYPWDGDYIWAMGNYSCDCNRAIFFGDECEECGDGKFSIRIVSDGELVYADTGYPS
jgi:hypothetical protein